MSYSNYGSISYRFWDIQCREISRHWNPGQGSIKIIESGTIWHTGYGFLLVFYSNFVFVFEIFDFKKMPWPWKPGQGSVNVTEYVTIRQSTYDFLLTFHSKHEAISYRFRGRRRLQSKIAKFSHPLCILRPAEGFSLELGTGVENQKN